MSQLRNGQAAPDFEAITDQDISLRLSDLRGTKVILYFYPRDNTSGCTTQACLFRDLYSEFEEKDAVVLGVSPDGVVSHRKFKAKHELPFTLLADTDQAIAQKYGVWAEKSMYGRKYMGIIRSHFVIDESGTIVDAQYKVSPKNSVERAHDAVSGM